MNTTAIFFKVYYIFFTFYGFFLYAYGNMRELILYQRRLRRDFGFSVCTGIFVIRYVGDRHGALARCQSHNLSCHDLHEFYNVNGELVSYA